jgi:hypothetical protein
MKLGPALSIALTNTPYHQIAPLRSPFPPFFSLSLLPTKLTGARMMTGRKSAARWRKRRVVRKGSMM